MRVKFAFEKKIIILLLLVINSLLTLGNEQPKCEDDGQDIDVTVSKKGRTGPHCSTDVETRQSTQINEDKKLWEKIRQQIKSAEDQVPECSENDWKSDPKYVCKCYTSLINEDLKPFSNGITLQNVEDASKRGVLYQIRSGKLYRDSDCKFPARCTGVEHFIMKLVPHLKDMEFVINVSDWPQISSWLPNPLPLLSFSKTKEYADIIYPAWTFWAGGPAISLYPKGLGRWDLMRKTLIAKSEKIKWNEKAPLAFFRGSRTSSERDPLVILSRKYPELVDAQYTKNQAWKSEKDTLNAKPAQEVTLEEHCQYKYLFNYRGVAASFRFKHLFLCGSLVFHVGDEWIEFFYPQLRPWIHYVPVEKNADEKSIKQLLEFFSANDDLASKIANRGYRFIKQNLKVSHVLCYWRELLTKYGDLLKYNINPNRKNLIQIT